MMKMENAESDMAMKPRIGRPELPEGEHQTLVPVRFPPDLIRRLDEEIAERGIGMSRSALIREFVGAGLLAAERKRK